MKEIKLSQGLVALVDDADYDYLNQWRWYAGESCNTFYVQRNQWLRDSKKCRTVKMHRLIVGVTDPSVLVDHKDGDGLNNQRSNLRVCTRQQNNKNRRAVGVGSSGFKGVGFHSRDKVWWATIGSEGKDFYLGSFKTEIEAAKAYNDAALRLHGEFACLNTI